MSKILVVDDDIQIREFLRRALNSYGYEVTSVPSVAQALEIILHEPFELILLDLSLGDGSGLSVLKKIREYHAKIPIFIYSGAVTPEIEKEARLAGASEVLSKSIGIPQLAEQIKKFIQVKDRILRSPDPEGREKCILIVDDEESVRGTLKNFFKNKGYKILEAENGEKALQFVDSEPVSVVLLDVHMPGMDGITTLQKLLERYPKLGIVMATGKHDDERVKKALELGAYGYVLKPFDFLYLDLVVMSKLAMAGSA